MNSELSKALTGYAFSDGWMIKGPRVRTSSATGACHCMAFVAQHGDGRQAFVKVLV
jgi:hypothetical protein